MPGESVTTITIEQTIEAKTHGRYLVRACGSGPALLLVGFHGYAEPAETHLERMAAVRGVERWTAIAIQGLHRFYQRRTDTVIASWMTRQDRELAIADNQAYVAAVIEAEWAARLGSRGVVLAGFSQGVAMAFRAAAECPRPVLGVVAVGGDIPPELGRDSLAPLGRVLLMRGERDDWYTAVKFRQDQDRLRDAVVDVTAISFDGGHEWSEPVLDAAAAFLAERLGD